MRSTRKYPWLIYSVIPPSPCSRDTSMEPLNRLTLPKARMIVLPGASRQSHTHPREQRGDHNEQFEPRIIAAHRDYRYGGPFSGSPQYQRVLEESEGWRRVHLFLFSRRTRGRERGRGLGPQSAIREKESDFGRHRVI